MNEKATPNDSRTAHHKPGVEAQTPFYLWQSTMRDETVRAAEQMAESSERAFVEVERVVSEAQRIAQAQLLAGRDMWRAMLNASKNAMQKGWH